jgi:hypothetical protein
MSKAWTTGILFSSWKPAATAFCLFMALSSSMGCWGQAPQGAGASGVLSQLAAAFSGGQVIQQVQLTGTATWIAGSLQDSGTASLTASRDGSSQMQLALNSTGIRTETQTGIGEKAECQWKSSDGVPHNISSDNCWKPTLWFLPSLSLQPSLVNGDIGIADLGVEPVGTSNNSYRHLQGQLLFTSFPAAIGSTFALESTTDLGLDPTSLLPAVLAYSLQPESGLSMPIAIEIHYSNYQKVNGAQIPFLIQRYVNGSLQLAIVVDSAQVN